MEAAEAAEATEATAAAEATESRSVRNSSERNASKGGDAGDCLTSEHPELQLALQSGDVEAVRFFAAEPGTGLSLLCLPSGKSTPLELAVSGIGNVRNGGNGDRNEDGKGIRQGGKDGGKDGEEAAVGEGLALAGALFEAPNSELALGLARLRRRLALEAQSLPRLASYWYFNSSDGSDGLEALRQMVPRALHPTAAERESLGDIPYNWLTFYQVKVMCANAHSTQNASMRREMELLLSAQGFDSFARNYSLGAILLSLVLFVFGLLVYVSFRLRVFGWLDTPISMAEMLPGAFAPERLADADFDPSRQKKQLPYRFVKGQLVARPTSTSDSLSNFFQAVFGIYASWLLLCVRIPPEKDTFDEEYLTDDDEECRLRVRNVCAFRAKNVGAVEVIFRALCLCGLEAWLLCYARRFGDAVLLNLLYLCYARMVASVAASSVPTPMPEKTDCDAELMPGQEMDAAGAVTAVFGVQHGPRWARAQCTTRSTAAPNKTKRQRRLRRRETAERADRAERAERGSERADSGTEPEGQEVQEGQEAQEGKEVSIESPEGQDGSEVTSFPSPVHSGELGVTSFSDRFQRQLLNAGVMHVHHSALLEQSVVSMCSCFLSVLFLMHLRWTFTGNLRSFYASEPLELVQAYGLPDSLDRLMAMGAELLLMWLCFERLYDISSLLHAACLALKQRNAALRFMREHQPPWPFTGSREVPLDRATIYCEEVIRCSDFALELSDARWRILQRPVEVVVFMAEALLILALLLIALPFLPWPQASAHFASFGFLEPVLDPVVPLTIGLVVVSPVVHAMLQAHFANTEVARQQAMLRSKADAALSASTTAKVEEDVPYVRLRNCSREAFGKATLRWSSGRALGLWEPILLLYFALTVVVLATMTKLNFIVV